jgi:hypothetical protein
MQFLRSFLIDFCNSLNFPPAFSFEALEIHPHIWDIQIPEKTDRDL